MTAKLRYSLNGSALAHSPMWYSKLIVPLMSFLCPKGSCTPLPLRQRLHLVLPVEPAHQALGYPAGFAPAVFEDIDEVSRMRPLKTRVCTDSISRVATCRLAVVAVREHLGGVGSALRGDVAEVAATVALDVGEVA